MINKISGAEIKIHFERIGKEYNLITNTKFFQCHLERRKRYLREFCQKLGKNKTILDLACGVGNYSESLSNYNRLINIDLSFNALKTNLISPDKVAKINADAFNIPLKDNSIDSVLLIGLLHHVPYNLTELFQEILRVLKNDGTIFIDEANGYNIMWFLFMKLCEIDKAGTRPLFPRLLKRLARDYCLTIEKELYWGFIPFWPDKKIILDIFSRIEPIIEESFLSCLCTRYLIILRRRQGNENN